MDTRTKELITNLNELAEEEKDIADVLSLIDFCSADSCLSSRAIRGVSKWLLRHLDDVRIILGT